MAWQWYHDTFEPGEIHLHALTGIIATRRTKYQTVEIVESQQYGKMLILDGDCQSSVKDEYIYHECLNEPAMVCHPDPRRILVVGGGEGAPDQARPGEDVRAERIARHRIQFDRPRR